ncbi:MAG: hypothetical protein AAB548_02745 [Patescibacteria group bacterium]
MTVIRLPEEELEIYRILAAERGLSLAEYFRIAARKEAGLAKKIKTSKFGLKDLGTKIVFRGGPRRGSVDHDRYYYEREVSNLSK